MMTTEVVVNGSQAFALVVGAEAVEHAVGLFRAIMALRYCYHLSVDICVSEVHFSLFFFC